MGTPKKHILCACNVSAKLFGHAITIQYNELQVLDQFSDELKANSNTLFIARVTWNGTHQLLYRVYDPDVANEYLTGIINAKTHAREFDFRMERDDKWRFAEYYLQHWEGKSETGTPAETEKPKKRRGKKKSSE